MRKLHVSLDFQLDCGRIYPPGLRLRHTPIDHLITLISRPIAFSTRLYPPPSTSSLLSTTTSRMAQTYPLFCMGNPLLDMQVNNGEAMLEKYKLKANDAILAGEEHMSIYEEIVEKYKITYVAGGAAQNAARAAAVRSHFLRT
ncbi:hypothetical protein RSAG8_10509, partial [Rhizoctonia solani AG-8 WAC10335]